jgi:heat shock protein HslJ
VDVNGKHRCLVSGLVFGMLLLAACLPRQSQAVDPGNANYSGFSDLDGVVQLADGSWQGEPWVEGGASRPAVSLLPGFELEGDLDGDGRQDRVVFLNQNMGGTGQLLYLVLIPANHGADEAITVTLIGDRIQLRGGQVENGAVLLDVLQPGAQDAMCCPGELATRAWELNDVGELAEIESAVMPQRFSVEFLSGTSWSLARWAWDEPYSEGQITLSIAENSISGSAACNTYRGEISDGDTPGEITLGPLMTTRMACPAEVMEQESRFQRQLSSANKIGFMNGQLMVSGVADGVFYTMFFDPSEGQVPNPH